MWIVKAALKNPYAVVVFALMILVLGALAIWNIPVDILPVFKAPAIISLFHEGVIGILLVALMILLFLGNARMTLIAGMSIVLAILSAIACLFATGNTINAMTLGGLALAIGPLVDT